MVRKKPPSTSPLVRRVTRSRGQSVASKLASPPKALPKKRLRAKDSPAQDAVTASSTPAKKPRKKKKQPPSTDADDDFLNMAIAQAQSERDSLLQHWIGIWEKTKGDRYCSHGHPFAEPRWGRPEEMCTVCEGSVGTDPVMHCSEEACFIACSSCLDAEKKHLLGK